MVNTAEACQVCGASVSTATSLLSDKGVLCTDCFGKWEDQQRAAEAEDVAKERVWSGRAWRLGGLHGVNWGTALILLAGWTPVPGWLSSILIFGVLGLAYGLRFRSRIAFHAFLVLDTAGALVFLVTSAFLLDGAKLVFLMIPVAIALWLARLTWRERDAFAKILRL
jgi:hypothetical protein